MASAKWTSFVIFLFFISAVVQTVNSEGRRGQGRCSRGNRKPQPCEELYTVDKDGCCRPCKCRKGYGRPREAKNPCADDCQRCELGRTYNDKFDFFCKPCQGCYDNRIVEEQCTLSRNRKCGEGCIPGYYRRMTYSQELEENCVPCTKDNMNILVCNLYFNVPLNRSTTKGLTSTIRASYPDSNTKASIHPSIQNSTEHAATSMTEFKRVTTVAMSKYTTEPTVTKDPNLLSANSSGKFNSSMNGTYPNGGQEKGGRNPMPVIFWQMIGGLIVLVLSVNIVMFIIWWITGKNPVEQLREIMPWRETGTERNAASMMSYDEKVDSVGQNTRNRGPGNFNWRAKTRPSECSQETPSLSDQSHGSDTGPEEGDRLTHSYQGAIAGAGENTSISQLSAEPVGGTLSYSDNRGEFTSETTSHNQNREENNSITHLKQIKKPRGTLHEAQPLLGPLSSLRHYKPNSSKGCYNRNLAEKCQARVDLQLKINLPAKSRGMGVTYESAANPTTPDDDDLHFGITAVDDSNFVQAQQAQEDLEQKENTEQKRVV